MAKFSMHNLSGMTGYLKIFVPILLLGLVLWLFQYKNSGSVEKSLSLLEDSLLSELRQNGSAVNLIDSTDLQYTPAIRSKIWEKLLDIEYDTKGVYGYVPHFKESHQTLDQKEIIIEGYMYPLEQDDRQNFFMLSCNPLSSCFFCGGAGPESIIEVNSPEGILLQEKSVRLKGILHLNTKEPERLFYILHQAVLVEE